MLTGHWQEFRLESLRCWRTSTSQRLELSTDRDIIDLIEGKPYRIPCFYPINHRAIGGSLVPHFPWTLNQSSEVSRGKSLLDKAYQIIHTRVLVFVGFDRIVAIVIASLVQLPEVSTPGLLRFCRGFEDVRRCLKMFEVHKRRFLQSQLWYCNPSELPDWV